MAGKSKKRRQVRDRRAGRPSSLEGRPTSTGISNAWICILAAGAVVGIYWFTTSFQFLFDDVSLFKTSQSLHSVASIPRGFVTDIGAIRHGSATVQGSFYRPMFLAFSTLYYQVVGSSTVGWHVASLILAALVAAAAALFFRRLGFPSLVSLLAALVFALHPSHVGSVAWVSGIQESLVALFVMTSLLFLLSPRAEEHPRATLAMSAAAFVLALLSKEVSVALFPLVAVWAFAKRQSDAVESRRFGRAALVFAGLTVVYVAARFAVLGGLVRPWAEAPGFARSVPSLPLAFVTYVKMLLFPFFFSFFRPERPIWGFLDTPILLSVAALAILTVVIWFGVKKRPALLLPVAWFVIWLLPVMNFWALFPEWMVTDRYLYLPSLALPWAVVVLLPRRSWVPTLAAVAVVFGFLTVRYAAIFVSPKVFSTTMGEVEPTSSYDLEERGRVLQIEGKRAAAEATYRRALAIDPWDAYTLWKIGTFERDRGEFAAAEVHYRQATVEEPNQSEPYTTLASALARAGQKKKALALLREAVYRWPDRFEPRLEQALLLADAGDRRHAEEAFAAARRLKPGEPVLVDGLDKALVTVGNALGLAPR
jgi:Flp pilus assembly protein TadD